MFIPCFICAEFLDEKNCLSVLVRTLCMPWSSEQTLLFCLGVNESWPPRMLPWGGRTPSTRGFGELGDTGYFCFTSAVFGEGLADASSVGERGYGIWESSPE